VGRDAARLAGTIERAETRSGLCIGITTDLTVAGAAQRVVDEAIDRLGRIDAVVHSAGILESSKSDESLEVFDRQWVLNVACPTS
jgi:NAD(P)-dependent dehydrogenase (short-subunit alcohol dehydrogenase family)